MLDLKFVREHPEKVREAIALKNEPADLDRLLELDGKRRRLLQEAEELKRLRNRVSKEIGLSKGDRAAVERKKEEMRQVSGKIKELDEELRRFDGEMEQILLRLPNIPDPAVPSGEDEADNMEVRSWGEPPQFPFSPRPHWEIGEMLGIIDFPRAGKITGSRFALYCGDGARLERALINFMLDLHTGEHGYREIFPPFLVNSGSMTGTGQLPKFAEDAFKVEGADYYLIPTAEVPVTNLHRDEILDAADLPLRYVAYSACFRSEAGAHGRDTRGLIRNHQFNKVELVKFALPENSNDELESLTRDAERVLQLLGLPYRVMLMCSGDLGFAAAKKYDLEVWLPSAGTYREISSCSNFTDFQARRAGIRYRPAPGQKAQFVHTLNGSGVAVGRTVAAILENFQQGDGSVLLPEVLRPYFNGRDRITPP
ncbi:MAG TPA: serine--tRNA ligase [Bacillota bacterium]|jgi:seryl-tRNA synthetase|nr:serine--tRNA ligase [Bacillota bacterium]HOA36256.1 serine--tRNA ligase [Bacillota bacterium]HOJ84066.1 serine--tRNA ligase [Bacillota bacterium]HPZ12295.1 serine--tRNA ligase [Bacillota bacterium]HQE09350.1 serine--tRNA ligase [Bacillota bacterium]